jgi:hypothetical protein
MAPADYDDLVKFFEQPIPEYSDREVAAALAIPL